MNRQNTKTFSIIELMTVILIILLLISLIIPVFSNLKMNARTSLCRNQLRQMGVLINSYQTDHGGYLPNDSAAGAYSPCPLATDIPVPKKAGYYDYGPNNELYRNWNGHLLPYLDVYLPAKFTRFAMVTKIGTTRYHTNQLGGPANGAPANPLEYGWVVVDDALKVGGYNDLKSFICPEIHQSTFDIGASINFNGIKIPRISQLCNQGFQDQAGYDYSMNGGIPTTYVAHDKFFGLDDYWSGPKNSYRVDQINNISKKAFLLEGGSIGTSTYYGIGDTPYDGGNLSSYTLDNYSPLLSFVHDNFDKFWIMPAKVGYGGYFPNMWWGRNTRIEVVNKFNEHFAPKAYMIEGTQTSSSYDGCSIVSYVDPAEYGPIFTAFFVKNFPGTIALNPFKQYVDETNEYKFMTGNTNVLFGDGSAVTKEQAWLYNNRRLIAGPSQN